MTQAGKLVPAVKALGVDVREAVELGEADAFVYLLDQAGAGWGYRYEWERYGPFSEALAAELVALTEEDLQADAELDEATMKAVERVRPLMSLPSGVQQYTWIRLLASLDFLQRYAGTPLVTTARPPYIEGHFEQAAIHAAVERLQRCPLTG